MSDAIIITISVLLLLAYVFDLSAARTKIPAVILLLLLGWFVRQVTDGLGINVPDLTVALPILGTIGLILIVLEGSLELELPKSKSNVIIKSFLLALIPMVIFTVALGLAFQYFTPSTLKEGLINAIPFGVISSAVVIPSAKYLTTSNKEFVVYESSLSDILGILLFNFLVLNDPINAFSFGKFGLQLLIMAAVSFLATLGLAYLLRKIEHHIKFAPIIVLLILIYAVSEVYHLPALIFIIVLGIFLGNLDELAHIKWIHRLRPEILNREVYRFREITVEATFLIRSLFFLLFGYLIVNSEILNTRTLTWALAIVAAIFLIRGLYLWISRIPLFPLLFLAPRGLITILLFLAIPVTSKVTVVNKSLIIQVIVLSTLVMMFGLMWAKKPVQK